MIAERNLRFLSQTVSGIRRETFEGREHVVLPIVALIEGVIQAMNAPHPELVLSDTFTSTLSAWNGRPVFLGHPMENGSPVSGNTPAILQRSFGRVFNARVDGKRLVMEAWVDPSRAPEGLLRRAESGEPIEVSCGAFVRMSDDEGHWDGRRYRGAWKTMAPDHLAILPEGIPGACSVDMGCGVRAAGGPGSGWHAEDGHVSGSQGGEEGQAGSKPGVYRSDTDSSDRLSNPSTEKRPAGTVVAKSKYGEVKIAHSMDDAVRYSAYRKSGEGVGSFKKVQSAMDALRAPTNTQSFQSGYRRPEVEWKILGGPGSGWFEENGHTTVDGHVEQAHGHFENAMNEMAKDGDARTHLAEGRKSIAQVHAKKGNVHSSLALQHATNAMQQHAAGMNRHAISSASRARTIIRSAGGTMKVTEKVKSLISKLKAAAGAEEQAELIGYETIVTLLDQAESSLGAASLLASELVAAEGNADADEEAESEIELAQLDSLHAFAMQATSSLYAACARVQEMKRTREPKNAAPMYAMSAADLKVAQGVHDHVAALGAECTTSGEPKAAASAQPCGCGTAAIF